MIGEIGLFNPAESTYMRPGAYDDALRANALKQASYLSAMDQFYGQLDETIREFNATLSFKEAELAQIKGLTESQIGLSKQQLEINQEQYKSDLALRQQALKAQTAYQTGMLKVEQNKVNLASWAYQDQKSSSSNESDSTNKALEFVAKYLPGGSMYRGAPGSGASTGTSVPSTGIGSYAPTPQSEQVDYGNQTDYGNQVNYGNQVSDLADLTWL
jgi:hypothetical protein